MTPRPRCVTPETTVLECAQIMKAEDVGALPIVIEPDRLVGIVTDRDLALRVVGEGLDARETPVANVATGEPLAVDPDHDLGDALVVMGERQLRRLPVVEDGERIVGILALADVALNSREKTAGDLIAEISRPGHGPRL